ncbi:Neurexin-3-beta [Cichlidogyrus casuarinus]|uniref:Neurexin-3-beta n=1 Tax=Cichlidogyrus casuarinus TaxID=1844966 RepID=A0ABD2QAI8_9PLAT
MKQPANPVNLANFGDLDLSTTKQPPLQLEARSCGFVLGTYTTPQKTIKDEFAIGFETTRPAVMEDNTLQTNTILFVEPVANQTDFIRLTLEKGFLLLSYNMGGGTSKLYGPNEQLNDGLYHRVRIFRDGLKMILEVDSQRKEQTTESRNPYSEVDDSFCGTIAGVHYNGVPISEVLYGKRKLPSINFELYKVTRQQSFIASLGNQPKFVLYTPKKPLLEKEEGNSKSKDLSDEGIRPSTEVIPTDPAQIPDRMVNTENWWTMLLSERFNKWLIAILALSACSILGAAFCVGYRCRSKKNAVNMDSCGVKIIQQTPTVSPCTETGYVFESSVPLMTQFMPYNANVIIPPNPNIPITETVMCSAYLPGSVPINEITFENPSNTWSRAYSYQRP